MRARVDGGAIVEVGVPRTWSDGDRDYANYPARVESDPELAVAHGWLPVDDDETPTHDPDTQRVVAAPVGEWQVDPDRVLRTWQVVDRPPSPDMGDHLDPAIGAPDG